MSKGTILITGATGFIGSNLLLAALGAGYQANVVIRSEAKAGQLKDLIAAKSRTDGCDYNSRCQYFSVPDLTAPGALDHAAAGATFMFHCATPMCFTEVPPERQQAELIDPAVNCTLRALESAKKAGTIRRVVIMSSMGAFASPELVGPGYVPQTTEVVSEASLNEYKKPPYSNTLVAYCQSKTASLRRSMEWMAEATENNTAGFDLINIAPTFVFGRQPLAQSVRDMYGTSNGLLLRVVAGKAEDGPQPIGLGGACAVGDVVTMCMKSLDKQAVPTSARGPNPGVENFCVGIDIRWDDIKTIVEDRWPAQTSRGILPNAGDFPTKPNVRMDCSKAERTFGFKLTRLEKMVEEVVPQFMELQG